MKNKPEYNIEPLKFQDLHSEITGYIKWYNATLLKQAQEFFKMLMENEYEK